MTTLDNELLDTLEKQGEPKSDQAMDVIRWWEKKRLVYNIIVILAEIMMTISMSHGVYYHGIPYLLFGSAIFTFFANVSYTSGWSIELLGKYYFPNLEINETHRIVFFTLGSLFSVFVTINVYSSALAW